MKKQFFAEEAQYKTFASGLRREFKDLGLDNLSHNQILEIIARSMGHATYAGLKTLQPAEHLASPVAPPALRPTYPGELAAVADRAKYQAYRLFNVNGKLDFHATGGVLLSGRLLAEVDGTVEDIPGSIGNIGVVSRDESGGLDVDHNGTDLNWDATLTRIDLRGQRLFFVGREFVYPEDHLVLLDDDLFPGADDLFNLELTLEHKLPVRDVLVAACRRYIIDHSQESALLAEIPEDSTALENVLEDLRHWGPSDEFSVLGAAQWAAGFTMHAGEVIALRDSLK